MTQDADSFESHLFLVRLWREPQETHDFAWRGEVKSTVSGERRFFQSLAAMEEILIALVTENEGLPPSPSRAATQGPAE